MTQALIKSDRETISRLKRAAGDKSVAAYVRELAAGSPPPASHIEQRLDDILRVIDELEDRLTDRINGVLEAWAWTHKALLNTVPGYQQAYDNEVSEYYKGKREESTLEYQGQRLTPEQYEKAAAAGVCEWDAEMCKEVADNPALLDDPEWIEKHRDKPCDLTDIKNWGKDYDS